MNPYVTQFKRNPLILLSFVLLLSLTIGLCCMGFSAKVSAQRQMMKVEERYLSVGIPIFESEAWNSLQYEDLFPFVTGNTSFPFVKGEDVRKILGASVSGTHSLTALEKGRVDSADQQFDTYSERLAVLAVRCESIPYIDTYDDEIWEINAEGEFRYTVPTKSYYAHLTVLDILAGNDAYAPYAPSVIFYGGLYTADGQIPFEPGHTYLILGMFGPLPYEYAEDEQSHQWHSIVDEHRLGDPRPFWPDHNGIIKHSLLFDIKETTDVEGVRYCRIVSDWLPCFTEYTGSWQSFLDSEEGRIWRESVIPFCEMNYSAVSLVPTDNLYSLLSFAEGSSYLLEGRDIEREEYDRGDKVCLVSASWAQKNGISAGDDLTLDVYDTRLLRLGAFMQPSPWSKQIMVNVYTQEPLKEEKRIAGGERYRVVGIYGGPEFEYGDYVFDANTIYVPARSLDVPSALTDSSSFFYPRNYSVILENGKAADFEAELAERGFGGAFVYYDGGYEEAAGAIGAVIENANKLFAVGAAAFVSAGVLALFLGFRALKSSLTTARRLGEESTAVARKCLGAMALPLSLGFLTGTGLAAFLFKLITARFVSADLELPLTECLLCGLALFVILLVPAAVISCLLAGQNLMQKRQ